MPKSVAIQYLDTALAAGERPVAAYQQALRSGEEVLARRFAAGDPVTELVSGRAQLVDSLLRRAWRMLFPAEAAAALIAVGGYGRGELHPASDVDVLIMVGSCDDEKLNGAIAKLIAFLWDMGLEVGHSVRTLSTCVEEAAADITVVTNLMEARLIEGDANYLDQLLAATGPDRIWPSDRFFVAKWEEQQQRHRRYDDSASKLEPSIKGAPGGLRDIQMIGWVAKRHFGAGSLRELVDHGFLTEQEYAALHEGQQLLWRIRFALHLLTGRREDRLLFDHQRALAQQFGYEDDGANLAVEKFMQAYYRAVLELGQLNDMLLQHFRESILLHDELGEPQRINRRFQTRDGYVEVADAQTFVRYPLALLEVFLILQQNPELKGIRASTIRLMRVHRHLIDRRFRESLAARSLFMEIFRQPSGLTHALRHMNRYGILGAYLPAFAKIVGRMQYDLYHIYTVDEHTLFVVRNLRRFAIREFREEFPLLSDIHANLPKPELLYLAALFHDIAKGRGGDHSELGARDALEFCKNHGLSDYDGRLVAWLVENHLNMSITAQRKDIDDPEVVQEFAAKVGDVNRLAYLYLLTVADIRATNPQRWNAWKDALLRQLYSRTRTALARGLDHPQLQDDLIQEKQREAMRQLTTEGLVADTVIPLWASLSTDYFLHSTPDEIAWQTKVVLDSDTAHRPVVLLRHNRSRGGTEIFVCADDRDNLFAVTTQLIDQLRLNVMDARIQTADTSCTMNSFLVLEEDGSPIDDRLREHEIVETLREGLRNNTSTRRSVSRRMPRLLKYFHTSTEIAFTADEANHRTMMQLRTGDRPGLLSLVGYAFAECGIRLISAKISTIGELVEDLFVICDRHTDTAIDSSREECINRGIRGRLETEGDQDGKAGIAI